MSFGARLLVAATLAAGLSTSGCQVGCLGGGADCQVPSPCPALSFCPAGSAAPSMLEVRTLGQADAVQARAGADALAGRGDVLLGNGQVVAVISGLNNQNYLDPNGGSLLDLRPTGGSDGLNLSLPVVGILPRDSVYNTELRIIDERPTRVAVQVRGHLMDVPQVQVATLYELRPCDPGVRVRTEILNGTADTQLWALADGYYWSGREGLPFTPGPGQGFQHPSFNLLTINDAYQKAPFLADSTHAAPDTSYAVLSCSADQMEGFQATTVSAMGQPRTVVPPREYQVFERFLAVAERSDVAGAADLVLEGRRQLRGQAYITLSGKVDGGGRVLSERDAALVISEAGAGPAGGSDAAQQVPWTEVVPQGDGSFSARVPAGKHYVMALHSFGRQVSTRDLGVISADQDLGTLALPQVAQVGATVLVDGAASEAEIFVVPADDATASATAGSLFGQYDTCTPWLGPPHGGSPACNRFLVSAQRQGAAVPPGTYHFYAYHGPFATLERQTLTLAAGDTPSLVFHLQRLPLRPAGTIDADLHVHGALSFDSAIPEEDRVLAFAAADLQIIVATDHDVVYDYSDTITRLGLQDRMNCVPGVETTGHIPFLMAPGNAFPLVIGHYNFWPLTYQPGLPRNGGPFDELIEPGELMDRVDPLYLPGKTGISQLNHPYAPAEFGRDLGFPRAIGMDLTRDLPAQDDGTANGLYVRVPAGGHRNDDHVTQEVMNGTLNDTFLPYRAFWFYSLNQGLLRTGTANSDSHGLTDDNVGVPRNLVFAGTQPGPAFDIEQMDQAIRDGAVLGTNGPIILATVDAADGSQVPYGMRPFRPAPGAMLHLEVSAAPWVPVDEVRIVVNGKQVKKINGAALSKAPDPFGSMGLLRYQGDVPLSGLLPAQGDAWLVVEAGFPLLPAASLGGNGVPDTTDNNGDGVVDQRDVGAGMTVGPLNNPPPPKDEGDPRYHFAQVMPGSYPLAFTNPFILDLNGNGKFDPPGVQGGK